MLEIHLLDGIKVLIELFFLPVRGGLAFVEVKKPGGKS